MSEPESRLFVSLLQGAELLVTGIDEAVELVGSLPLDERGFAAMNVVQRAGATSLLKRVEQLEDVRMRLFPTYLQSKLVDTSEMFHRDVANQMEKLGAVPDASRWMTVVRLRNRLAHEYPVNPGEQLLRMNEAFATVETLRETVVATRNILERGEQ